MNSCFYSPAAFCTKATLLLLIARVFAVRPLISKAIHIFILAVLLAYIPIVFLKIFTCRPVSAYWEMPQMAGVSGNNPYCLDQARFFMGDIVIAVITDFLILILPIPLAWIMEAPRRQKIKIMILLGAGGAATATSELSLIRVEIVCIEKLLPQYDELEADISEHHSGHESILQRKLLSLNQYVLYQHEKKNLIRCLMLIR